MVLMKSVAVLGPLALWLVVAVPFYCHHGFTTVWAASTHAYYSLLDNDETAPAIEVADYPGSDSVHCQHQGSSADAPLGYAAVESDAGLTYSFLVPESPGGALALSTSIMPRGIALSPLERPPSQAS